MPCAYGLLAEDCAIEHWAPALRGQRERAGWRAPCPVCRSGRSVEWDAPGRTVRWRIFCPCEKAAVREAIAALLPGCLPPRRAARASIDHDDLIKLAQDTSLPPMTLRLRLLEMTGMSTTSALDVLSVRPDNRARVIQGRTGDRPSDRTRTRSS